MPETTPNINELNASISELIVLLRSRATAAKKKIDKPKINKQINKKINKTPRISAEEKISRALEEEKIAAEIRLQKSILRIAEENSERSLEVSAINKRILEIREELEQIQSNKNLLSDKRSPTKLLQRSQELSESGDLLASWILRGISFFKGSATRENDLNLELKSLLENNLSAAADIRTTPDAVVTPRIPLETEDISPSRNVTDEKLDNLLDNLEKDRIEERREADLERDNLLDPTIQKVLITNSPLWVSVKSFSEDALKSLSRGVVDKAVTKGSGLLSRSIAAGSMRNKPTKAPLPKVFKNLPILEGLFAGGSEFLSSGLISKSLLAGGGTFAGALAGAKLGSVGGPIGAAIGGVIGGVAGEAITSKLSENLNFDKLENRLFFFFDKFTENFLAGIKDIFAKSSEIITEASNTIKNLIPNFLKPDTEKSVLTKKAPKITLDIPNITSESFKKNVEALAASESSGISTAINKIGAAGLFQFLPSTAEDILGKMKSIKDKNPIQEEIIKKLEGSTKPSFKKDDKLQALTSTKQISEYIAKNYPDSFSARVSSLSAEEQTEMYKIFLRPLLEKKETPAFSELKTFGFAPAPFIKTLKTGEDQTISSKGDIRWKDNSNIFDKIDASGNSDGVITVNEMLAYYSKQDKMPTMEPRETGPVIAKSSGNTTDQTRSKTIVRDVPRENSSILSVTPTNNKETPTLISSNNPGKIYTIAAENKAATNTAAAAPILINAPSSTSIVNNGSGGEETDYGRDLMQKSTYNPLLQRLDSLYTA